MVSTAADGGEPFIHGRLRLSEAYLAEPRECVPHLSAPADGGAILTQGACVIRATADGDEPFTLRWRCLAEVELGIGRSPADGRLILPQSTGMARTAAELR